MSTFGLNYGALALTDSANGIAIEDINVQVGKNLQQFDLPKSDGSIIPDAKRRDISLKFKGTLTGSDYTTTRSRLRALINVLETAGEQKVTLDDDSYIAVKYRNFAWSPRKKPTFIDFSFDVVAQHPFWLSSTLTVTSPAWTTGNIFKINNAGSAQARLCVDVRAVGGNIVDDIKLQNLTSGRTLQYRGTVSSGRIVSINNKVDRALQKFGTGALGVFGVDYLSTPDHADFNLSGGTWTVDKQILPFCLIGNHLIWGQFTDANNYMACYVKADGTVVFEVKAASSVVVNVQTSAGVITAWALQHVEVCETGNTYKIYVDGVDRTNSGSSDTDRAANYTGVFTIGYSALGFIGFIGIIDEFRLSNSLRHSSGFTAPTAEYTADANTKLLLHMNGKHRSTNFLDSSASLHVMTVGGNARIESNPGVYAEVFNAGAYDIANLGGDWGYLEPGDNFFILTCAQSAAILSLMYREANK